jgi:Uma2 family endonuclease
MTTYPRFTSADLEAMSDLEGTRYEIIDGELFVSKQPHYHHQYACSRINIELGLWNDRTGLGVVMQVPGLVFDDGNDVVPDVVWMSWARREHALDAGGHFTVAPELVAEVLSYGTVNERRDREAKLKLYSIRGVHEYWIVDWRQRSVQVYRRRDAALHLVATLGDTDTLTSPLLPDFSLPVSKLWEPSFRPDAARRS